MTGDFPWRGKIGALTEDDLRLFLGLPWNARIATVTREGRPYVTPVWYEYAPDERAFYVVARDHAAWAQHITHNQFVALHIADDVRRERTRVLVEGRAEILEGPVEPSRSPRLFEITMRMSAKYLGGVDPGYGDRTKDRPRYLIRIVPDRWHTWTGPEWHPRYWKRKAQGGQP